MKFKIEGACKSVIGNVRNNNEDNYYFNNQILNEINNGSEKTEETSFENSNNKVCAVFDGMGGISNGEKASYIAANTMKEIQLIDENIDNIWIKYVENANENICNEMMKKQRIGTTMAGILFSKDYISICNVGDSRIYGLKDGKLIQISKDHTEAELQEKLNIETTHKARLTQHLGIKKEELTIVPYQKIYEYDDFEKLLICSDGLTDMLNDNEIEEIILKKLRVKDIVDLLVDKALEKGGIDNTTVIVLQIHKECKNENKDESKEKARENKLDILKKIVAFIGGNK